MDTLEVLFTLSYGDIIGCILGTMFARRVFERKIGESKKQTIQNTINVDWSLVLNALEGAGYTVIENKKIENEVRH